ncbi:MAG: hypothetical protein ACYSU7_19900 [Planctomycetota bacterium]
MFDEATKPTGKILRASLKMIHEAGRGAVVYMRPEGVPEDWRSRLQTIRRPHSDDINRPDLTRGDSVAAKVQPMHQRDFGVGSQILRDLGLRRLRILTNRPKRLRGLAGFGLEICDQVAVEC